jgi:hypothetical protein
MALTSFDRRRKLQRAAYDTSYDNLNSRASQRLPDFAGLRSANRARGIKSRNRAQNRAERIALQELDQKRQALMGQQRQQDFQNRMALRKESQDNMRYQQGLMRQDSQRQQENMRFRQGLMREDRIRAEENLRKDRADQQAFGLKKAGFLADQDQRQEDNQFRRAKFLADQQESTLDQGLRQRKMVNDQIDKMDISIAFQDVERLGGDPTGFVQDGQLTEDGKRFQEVWRMNLRQGMSQQDATQKALADVRSGRLSQGQRLFDQINKMTDDEFDTYKENLDENDLVREFSREEYLKELKSDISGKSGDLSKLDTSVNNKFRDQGLEKLKKTTSDALAITKQIYDQGYNEVSKAQAAKEVRELFEESGIKDVDNFDFGTGRRAKEIKEILSHYDPKIIELNEKIEEAKRSLSNPEKQYTSAFGASFGGGLTSMSNREERLQNLQQELKDYLEGKGK